MNKEKSKSTDSFANDSIAKVVITNSIPALIAMIMVMVYNLADTFFIGLTGNDLQVAAVSLASPVFMIFMSLGTLFGVGGSSVISRALGAGKTDYAKRASSFCFWASVGVGAVFMILIWIFLDRIMIMLGASPDTMDFARDYLMIVVGCGIFSMISNCLSNVIRTEGEPMKAMTGTLIGNLLNIILDPIMILGLGWGITGAAVATVIGNLFGALYYLVYFFRGKTDLSIKLSDYSMKDGICKDVIAIGISASLVNILASVTAIVANGQLVKYGDMYVAGYGVTSKVQMIITLLGIGVGSGVQPLFGFCYGANNKRRLVAGMKFSALFGSVLCFVAAAICFVWAKTIVGMFLTSGESCAIGMTFSRILMTTAWTIGAFAICQNALQAMGAAKEALFISVFRQGIILIPAMFIMQGIVGANGLLWAQPVADILSLIVIFVMVLGKINKMKKVD